MSFFRDLRLLFVRSVKGSLRNPVWLFIGFFQPIVYLLLFAPLLTNLTGIPGFPRGGAYTVFTPGLLVMLALFGTAYAGFGLVEHIREGFLERLLVTPRAGSPSCSPTCCATSWCCSCSRASSFCWPCPWVSWWTAAALS